MNYVGEFTTKTGASLCLLVLALVVQCPVVLATPLIALKEADNCDGCHQPGRAQRPFLDRRCTLDCQGCHVDPAGAGPRNQWGYYYSQDQLAAVNFFKPIDPLQDQSRFDLHYDSRLIRRKTDDAERTFPMSAELSLRVRPFIKYLHFTYQALLLGRIGDDSFRALRSDDRRFREKYAVMIDNLPLNTYLRAYRGQPMYGVRRPNHTLWIRERLGLEQYAATDAAEIGLTPNVPFFRASYMLGDPYAEPEDRQRGTSMHGGLRGVSWGWHVNGSAWKTSSDKATVDMHALGGGLKPWKFIFMGERNWRRVETIEDPPAAATFASSATRLHPSSQIDEWTAAFAGIPGTIVGHVVEELHDATTAAMRRSIFVDLHPIPYLQIEIWRRFESGTRDLVDTLGIVHVYADF